MFSLFECRSLAAEFASKACVFASAYLTAYPATCSTPSDNVSTAAPHSKATVRLQECPLRASQSLGLQRHELSKGARYSKPTIWPTRQHGRHSPAKARANTTARSGVLCGLVRAAFHVHNPREGGDPTDDSLELLEAAYLKIKAVYRAVAALAAAGGLDNVELVARHNR